MAASHPNFMIAYIWKFSRLLEVSQAFCKDGHYKINENSYLKCSLVACIHKRGVTATELGSKYIHFFQKLDLSLNINGSLNIQFN